MVPYSALLHTSDFFYIGVLLTLLYLMKAIDPVHEKYQDDITEAIEKLTAVDSKRKAFYRDLSKFHMYHYAFNVQVFVRFIIYCEVLASSIYQYAFDVSVFVKSMLYILWSLGKFRGYQYAFDVTVLLRFMHHVL